MPIIKDTYYFTLLVTNSSRYAAKEREDAKDSMDFLWIILLVGTDETYLLTKLYFVILIFREKSVV